MLTVQSARPMFRAASLVATTAALLGAAAGSASAACAPPPKGQDRIDQTKGAASIFLGTVQPGDALEDGKVVSPAEFQVLWRLDATGRIQARERIVTGVTRQPNGGLGIVSEGFFPRVNETWIVTAFKATPNADRSAPLVTNSCAGFNRPADPSHPRTVTAGKRLLTPSFSDLRGNPAFVSPAQVIPKGTKRVGLPAVDAARLVHGRRSTKLTTKNGWTSLRGARRGDRLVWLDDRGVWTLRIG